MSAATRLLDRLDRPKQTAPGRWMTGCPCCESRHGRPVSVRELEDGRVLIHPFCGCSTENVLTALGLTLADLFDKALTGSGPAGGYGPSHSRIPARDILDTLSHESLLIWIIASDILKKRDVTEDTWSLLAQAVGKIHGARSYVRG